MRTQITKPKYDKLSKTAREYDLIANIDNRVIGQRDEIVIVLTSGVKLIETGVGKGRRSFYIAFTGETFKAAFDLMAVAGVGLEGAYRTGSMV